MKRAFLSCSFNSSFSALPKKTLCRAWLLDERLGLPSKRLRQKQISLILHLDIFSAKASNGNQTLSCFLVCLFSFRKAVINSFGGNESRDFSYFQSSA